MRPALIDLDIRPVLPGGEPAQLSRFRRVRVQRIEPRRPVLDDPQPPAAAERARLLIEQAEALGEPPEDPLLLFSVLYGLWGVSYVAFNGNMMREHATQFLARAEQLGTTTPLSIAHRIMGTTLLCTGDIAHARAHLDRAITLDDGGEHGPPATRFGQDVWVSILSY